MSASEETSEQPEMQDYSSLLEHFNQPPPAPVKPDSPDMRIESIETRLMELEARREQASDSLPREASSANRASETAARVENLEATCAALSAEMASLQSRLSALQSDLRTGLQELQRRPARPEPHSAQSQGSDAEPPESDRERAVIGFWNGLTTLQKLECLSFTLAESSRLTRVQRAARETAALLEPAETLLKWALKYPSACAEKLGTLFLPLQDDGSEIERLTILTLQEMHTHLEATLQELGLRYDAPALGAPASSQWETVGTEASLHPKGTVARILRGGLTYQGRSLVAPAVIVSNGEPMSDTTSAPPPALPGDTNEQSPLAPPADWPEAARAGTSPVPPWLTTLQAATLGSQNTEESRLLALFERLAFEEGDGFLESLEQVLPLLSPCRHFYALPVSETWRATWEKLLPEFTEWLKTERSITPLSPSSNEGIDTTRMEVTDTRQTLHEAERDRVSRLERPGAMQGGRVLFRAQVQAYRYERG